METSDLEQRLTRLALLLGQAQSELTQLRADLGVSVSAEERWARMMLGVLGEIEQRGGAVPREEVLAIGERHGYSRRGMAGFYQGMLRLEAGVAILTDSGRERLARLRENYNGPDDPQEGERQ